MYKADQVFSAKQWNVPNMPNQPCDPNSTNHVFYLLRIRQMGKRQKFLKTSEKEWWLHYRPGRASSGCLLIFVVSKLQRIHKLKPYMIFFLAKLETLTLFFNVDNVSSIATVTHQAGRSNIYTDNSGHQMNTSLKFTLLLALFRSLPTPPTKYLAPYLLRSSQCSPMSHQHCLSSSWGSKNYRFWWHVSSLMKNTVLWL